MQLRPGTRLESATCATQVVIVKAPAGAADIDLRCGGEPMRAMSSGGEPLPLTSAGEGTKLGKRYADAGIGLEVLCTRGGAGSLAVGDVLLLVKEAKPLPSSD